MLFLLLQKRKRRGVFAGSVLVSDAGTAIVNGRYRSATHLGWPAWVNITSGVLLQAVSEDGDQYVFVDPDDAEIIYYTSIGINPSTGVITDYPFQAAASLDDVGIDPQPTVTYI